MSLKKLLSCVLVGAQLCVTVPVFADTTLPDAPSPVPGEVDVGAAISPMKKGQVAPFTGVLLSPKAIASVVAEISSVQDRVKVEVDHANALSTAQCDFKVAETTNRLETDKKFIQAQADEQAKQVAILNDQLKKEESSRTNTPLWVSLGITGGFIVGVAATVVSVFAVNKVTTK